MVQSNLRIFQSHKESCYTKGIHRKGGTVRAAQSLMSLKKSSNLIGPCDRLLQEPISLPRKISRTFHESYQSNTAIVMTTLANMSNLGSLSGILVSISIIVVVNSL